MTYMQSLEEKLAALEAALKLSEETNHKALQTMRELYDTNQTLLRHIQERDVLIASLQKYIPGKVGGTLQ